MAAEYNIKKKNKTTIDIIKNTKECCLIINNGRYYGDMDDQQSTSHPARLIFAGNMRKVRRFREISQENLALDAGISRAYLGEVERANRAVSIDVMGKIADALGVPLSDLLKTNCPIFTNH